MSGSMCMVYYICQARSMQARNVTELQHKQWVWCC